MGKKRQSGSQMFFKLGAAWTERLEIPSNKAVEMKSTWIKSTELCNLTG